MVGVNFLGYSDQSDAKPRRFLLSTSRPEACQDTLRPGLVHAEETFLRLYHSQKIPPQGGMRRPTQQPQK
jgi:hypothetical protein